jgi:DNA-binding NtrC family response regulator
MKRERLLPGVRILVVDDEPDLRDVISSRLQLEGGDVMVAENGKSAIEVMKDHQFDAIVSDIRMPGGNGMELLESLRAGQSRPAFILISGFSDISTKDAMARGAQALLVKPFDLDDMISAVFDAIKK